MKNSPPFAFRQIFAIGLLTALHCANAPAAESTATVTIDSDHPGLVIPADFLGFSYEKSILAETHFAANNTELLNLLGNLGNGILRIGGNGVEFTYWARNQETGTDASTPPRKAAKGEHIIIGPSALDRFFAFAKQSGWRVIYGLNLGANDPAQAADEAAYAWKIGGSTVLAFEVGNEPNLYHQNGVRPESYTYAAYCDEVRNYFRQLLAAMPKLPLAGPSSTRNPKWVPDFARDFHPTLATGHIYPLAAKEQNTQSPRFASIENLLGGKADEASYAIIEENQKGAAAAHVPFRLDECNSAAGGGAEGVCDVFASALWSADFAFNMAERGVTGVNFHGNFRRSSSYAPIQQVEDHYQPRPLYYGLLLFHEAAHGRLVRAECKTSANFSAHAVRGDDGKLRVVLLNKETDKSITASVVPGSLRAKAELMRLIAPSAAAKDGITLAGNAVAMDGKWTPGAAEAVQCKGGIFEVILPAASAALLTIE